jgi:hypothetical protein
MSLVIELYFPMVSLRHFLPRHFSSMGIELVSDSLECTILDHNLQPPEYLLLYSFKVTVVIVNLLNFFSIKVPFDLIEQVPFHFFMPDVAPALFCFRNLGILLNPN